MDNIFIFDRPFFRAFNRNYSALYGNQFQFHFLSDFRGCDTVKYADAFYRNLKILDLEERDLGVDYADVAIRCRYLRCQNPETQRKLINAHWLAIQEIFNKFRPVAAFGFTIDNYVLDLLNRWMKQQGIFVLNPIPSMLPGLARCTVRGEHNFIREVPDEEITQALTVLRQKNFKARYVNKPRGPSQLFRLWAKQHIKKVAFEVLKVGMRDPFNFQFNAIYPLPTCPAIPRFGRVSFPEMVSDIEEIKRRAKNYKRTVFLPLQFTPETALDYFIADNRFTRYEELVATVLRQLPADTFLVCKEHPDYYGFRNLKFYDQFTGRENVALTSIDIASQEIIRLSDFVVVTGGASIGIEAVAQGKTVIALGGSYYSDNGRLVHDIPNFDEVANWPQYLSSLPMDESHQHDFLRQVMSSCLKVGYNNVWVKKDGDEESRSSVRAAMEVFLRTQKSAASATAPVYPASAPL